MQETTKSLKSFQLSCTKDSVTIIVFQMELLMHLSEININEISEKTGPNILVLAVLVPNKGMSPKISHFNTKIY